MIIFMMPARKGARGPGRDDDPSCWLPKETNPEDRGTPLIGRVRDGGKAEPNEDWQEDWGRRIQNDSAPVTIFMPSK